MIFIKLETPEFTYYIQSKNWGIVKKQTNTEVVDNFPV